MYDNNHDPFSARLTALEDELAAIKKRNKRVESDKAWETSLTRMAFLLVLTYLMTALVFWLIAAPSPLLNALIPTLGYFLSAQSLPIVKRWWLARST